MKKPKKLTPPPVDNRKELHVEIKSSCVYDECEGVQFGSWEKKFDETVVKISRDYKILNRFVFSSYKVPDEVYNATYVYIVAVTYSSGDTFGSSSGNTAIAFITENPEEALKAKDAVECNWSKPEWSKHPKNVAQYPSWTGYFESVENVKIVFLPVIG